MGHARYSDPANEPTAETTAALADPPGGSIGERLHGVLVVLSGSHSGALYILDQRDTAIGRARTNQVWLTDEGLSRVHCRIVRREDGYYLEDARSTNGTVCQGQVLSSPRRLEDGDRIAIGRSTLLRFSLQDEVERHASRQTLELQIRDPLTNLPNRRHFDGRLHAEFAFARRHNAPLAVLMVDLDHFKRVNDTLGHAAGDAVLRAVAQAIEGALRVEDTVGRYGGEELVILVRGIDIEGVLQLGERLRVLIEALRIPFGQQQLRITASIGGAMLSRTQTTGEELITAADRALYRAKEQGRNRVVIA
jgi:two-component system cell cycle response regulator